MSDSEPLGNDDLDSYVDYWVARRRPRWVVALVAVLGLAWISSVQLGMVRERIETRLAVSSRQALDAAGFTSVAVVMRGRDARLGGSLVPGADPADALDAVTAVRGVRVATFPLTPVITAPTTEPAAEPSPPPAGQAPASDPSTGATPPSAAAESSALPSTDLADVADRLGRLDPIGFAPTSANLTPESFVVITNAAQIIDGTDPATNFLVGAHTDSAGEAEANDQLSEQRAAAVVVALVAAGVAADRLQPVGYGESNLAVSPEVTEADRAVNRRVEIVPLR